jgi:hypothetical protein
VEVAGLYRKLPSNDDRPMTRSTVLSGWGRWAGRSCWAVAGLCRARGNMAHGKHCSLPGAVSHNARQRIFLIFLCFCKSDIQIFANVFQIVKL